MNDNMRGTYFVMILSEFRLGQRRASFGFSIMVVVVGFGCSAQSDGNADDRKLVPECATYIVRLNECMRGISPDVMAQRTEAARQAFSVGAKDDASRERLGAQCKAGLEQLARACR
ncbi:hypothetical protein [Pendulispora albinea]|uniref:Uncharacterized protein n=1 Tax=Pendulispora albinea TaxID=2741071 RepID=A0ABZ2LMW2_9BACT